MFFEFKLITFLASQHSCYATYSHTNHLFNYFLSFSLPFSLILCKHSTQFLNTTTRRHRKTGTTQANQIDNNNCRSVTEYISCILGAQLLKYICCDRIIWPTGQFILFI